MIRKSDAAVGRTDPFKRELWHFLRPQTMSAKLFCSYLLKNPLYYYCVLDSRYFASINEPSGQIYNK